MKSKIVYGKVVCDFYEGLDNLDMDDMLEILGYEDLEEFKEDNDIEEDIDESDVRDYFIDYCDVDFEEIIENNGLEVLDEEEDGYYISGCAFIRNIYKVKGSKEDFDSIKDLWFVVDFEEVDLENNWINGK